MNYETIEVQKGPGAAVVWLNRPEVRNAFNETMLAELTAAFDALDADAAVRAVALAGRGKVFCAGADLNWMRKMAGYGFEENRADAMALARMLARLRGMKKPTVARVHGAAFAGGVGLLAACDIAVAAADAEFSLSEVKLGLTPATISPYVIAAMGERAARRYFLTAERFTAAEAYRVGLVQEIVQSDDLDARVNELLGALMQGGPAAQAATKDLLAAVAKAKLDDELIADTAARIAAIRVSPEGQEGMRAFLEKREASWVAAAKQAAKKKPAKKRS